MSKPQSAYTPFLLFISLALLGGTHLWGSLPQMHNIPKRVDAANDAARSLTKEAEGDKWDRNYPDSYPSLNMQDGGDGSITFTSNRDGNSEIYIMNADGSYLERLTIDPNGNYWPSFSPDGNRIAFDCEDVAGNSFDICIIDRDKTGLINLTETPGGNLEANADWSPSGEWLVFVSGLWDGISKIKSDGTGYQTLNISLYGPHFVANPTWSQDGNRIAFSGPWDGYEDSEIWIMNSDGSNVTQLTNNSTSDISPDWSPDSSKIVFESNQGGDLEIYAMNPDGSGRIQLTNSLGENRDPSWSPDNNKIVFASSRDGNWEIYTMNADGSEQSQLTDNPAEDRYPSWGQDCHDSRDRDGDALLNGWELCGYDYNDNGEFNDPDDVHLPALGADPNKMDIFVEIDWMDIFGHDHRPDPEAIQTVIEAFDRAPVDNHEGTTGIALHVDFGDETFGEFTEGEEIPHQNILGTITDGEYDWSDFDDLKAEYFSPQRTDIFHYVIFAHSIDELCGPSGVSRGIPSSDFIVALGGYYREPFSSLDDPLIDRCLPILVLTGHPEQQAGTFMHELGHNLGLQHGGNDNINRKPNYLSVMNYLFQMRGLIINGEEGNFDYSSFSLGVPTLHEQDLDEGDGLSGGGIPQNYGTRRFNCNRNNRLFVEVMNANGPIDWNCDGDEADLAVSSDINGDGLCIAPGLNELLDTVPAGDDKVNTESILNGPNGTCDSIASEDDIQLSDHNSFNDWANLIFNGGFIGFGETGYELPEKTIVDEMTPIDAAEINPIIRNIYLPINLNG